jgi:polyadenylate-binding protein 2
LEKESIENALKLNDSLFRGRQLKVISKRTNIPGVSRGRGFPRGRGGRGGRRGRRPYYHPYGGF